MTFSERYQQIWNKGDRELAEKIFDKNISFIFNAISIQDKETVFSHILERKTNFNVQYEISDICTNTHQELEYHRWNAQAILQKKFEDFLPTGQKFSYSGLTLLKIKNDLISEIVMYSDIDEVLKKNKV